MEKEKEDYIERGEELLIMHLTCFLSFIRESQADLLARVLEKRSR